MRFSTSSVLIPAFAAVFAYAAPLDVVEDDGVFITSGGEVNTSVLIQDVPAFVEPGKSPKSNLLTKRTHGSCWPNDLTTNARRQAYIHDCETLVERNAASARSLLLRPGASQTLLTAQRHCKIVVRNQSTCHTRTPFRATIAASVRNTLDHCPSDYSHSGWGWIGAENADVVYIVEPYELAPPAYSPSCN